MVSRRGPIALPPAGSSRRRCRRPGGGTCGHRGRGDYAEPERAAGGRCCGADAPPPPLALGSEGAPRRPAPAGHVVPPRLLSRRPLPGPPSPAGPRQGSSARPACPTWPRVLLPDQRASPALPSRTLRGVADRGSEHLQPGEAQHPPLGTWYGVRKGCTWERRTQKSCDITESQPVLRESFAWRPLPALQVFCPCPASRTITSPEKGGGRPSTRTPGKPVLQA